MQQLSVVNLMLGTMGEKPLNSLTDSHALLSAALSRLDEENRSIQARGYWFNQEEVTLTPSSLDSGIYLPNDTTSVLAPTYNVVMRGNRLYNLQGGTYIFTSPLKVELIREVLFEDLPEVAATYVSTSAIASFQLAYDGDTAKARDLDKKVERARIAFNSEHTRQRKTNFIDSNVRLQRLKSLTSNARSGLY